MKNNTIPFGMITKVHGIHGNFVINAQSFDEPQNYIHHLLMDDGRELKPFPVEFKGVLNGNCIIVKSEQYSTPESAKSLVGTELFISREILPPLAEDEYYPCDIISFEVHDENGNNLGMVVDVVDFGSGTTIEVKSEVESKESLEYYLLDSYTKIDFEKSTVSIISPKYV